MHRFSIDFNFLKENNFVKERKPVKALEGFENLKGLIEKDEVGFTKTVDRDFGEILDFAKKSSGKYNDLILVGIGGSSLGFETLVNALLPCSHNSLSFSERGGYPRIWIADNVDPFKLHWIMKACEPSDTLICVVSKSGNTLETLANFSILYKWLKKHAEDYAERIVVVAGNEEGFLHKFAESNGFNKFFIPKNVGGRFSVFTDAAMLPAALVGIDIEQFAEGAKKALDEEKFTYLAEAYISYFRKKCINVLMPYSYRLSKFADWFCQLWAESLGKRFDMDGKEVFYGTTPLKSVGAIDQHSLLQLFKEGPNDKLFTFIEIENHEEDKEFDYIMDKDISFLEGHSLGELLNFELRATEVALKNSGRDSLKIKMNVLDEFSLGYLMMMFMMTVPIVGLAYNINPFDQPGVEEGKKYAYALMGKSGYEEFLKIFEQGSIKLDEYIV